MGIQRFGNPARTIGLALIASCVLGCGSSGPPARKDVLAIPAEEHYGGSIKGMLYVLCAKMEKRGVKGAQQDLPQMIENLQGYERRPLGNHSDTYRQIDTKLKELESLLKGSPTDAAVKQAAEELRGLAGKLPGKADEKPKVE